ncbi:Metal-dependent hydrolase, endonuclease/exonuclease/phosphatase family [Cohaesibacter sp. ES.047]|uniref:endonuclease/exonuclease/phosphatase family protein n=1 Tax=Cohaesibacter sp. ES.047 TaxID=1798205 RepID=UPI000BB78815|nr:endonuclease/exonuclease/phosphatase family protein [Cohaesibacter sp. ES.047]SNY91923.1 Metal-dependent hydrolase, endonuclease/exonuclease/phosphatase family [Cohaesibacter sp. ES.047]
MKLFETSTCSTLPKVEAEMVEAIQASERNHEAHCRLFAAMDAMHCLEVGGEYGAHGPIGPQLTAIAWNLQRCLYPEQSADILRDLDPDVVLVSEMDGGMARTHQRNTTRALADSLDMHYAFGLEFFELGLGNEAERRLAADDHNELGWHGNAVLSRVKPRGLALIRLDDHGHWFCPDEGLRSARVDQQPRVGGRCAIAAILPTEAGDVCAVSTHLENNAPSAYRQSQIDRLIAALDAFAPDVPVIIGGDLNTGGDPANGGGRNEPLFKAAERHGFTWDNNAIGPTTRKSPLSGAVRPKMQLDWFGARGLDGKGAQIIPALDEVGKVLSDHELIVGHFALPVAASS